MWRRKGTMERKHGKEKLVSWIPEDNDETRGTKRAGSPSEMKSRTNGDFVMGVKDTRKANAKRWSEYKTSTMRGSHGTAGGGRSGTTRTSPNVRSDT